MNEAFEKLCKTHSLNEKAKLDFKNLFEKEIIKVFHEKSNKDDTKSEVKKQTTKNTTKGNVDICSGKKVNGEECTSKAKENGYCGRHNPDKTTKTISKAKATSPAKNLKHECHAIIPKTGKRCILPGTIKPENADFHYCKRHSEKWTDFESDVNTLNEESDAVKEHDEEHDEE